VYKINTTHLVREDPKRKSSKDLPTPAWGINVRAGQEAVLLGMMYRCQCGRVEQPG
jgi:hypothetical protein